MPPMPPNELNNQNFQVDENYQVTTDTIPFGMTQLRFWRNTEVARTLAGGTAELLPSLLGYEWDSSPDNGFMPLGLVRLSSSTYHQADAFNTLWGIINTSGDPTNNITEFRVQSGALIFATGSVFWPWGLSDQHDNSPAPWFSDTPDPDVQQAMVNELADMGIQPQTLQANLVSASQSTDTTPPTSTISSVSDNNPTEGETVTVSGSATDVGGVIGGVSVSTDGGNTWNPASIPVQEVGAVSVAWTFSFTAPAPGTYSIKSRAVDDSANVE